MTMRAIAIKGFGGYEKVELLDLPVPPLKPDEVLIEVKAAGVGNWDGLVRQNVAGLGEEAGPFPVRLGWECAGVIIELGQGVDAFKVGQAVIAYPYQRGTWSEYVAAPVSSVAYKPTSLGFEEAAGLPVSGVTAHQTITQELKVAAGETILITGGAGTTARLAIQLAARLKAHVITTARLKHHALLKTLGASEVIDYTATDFEQTVLQQHPGGINAVMECVATGDNFFKSIKTLRPGGRIASIVSWDKTRPHRPNVVVHYVIGRPEGTRLAEIARMIDNGQLKVNVPQVLPLAQAAQAQRLAETGQSQGKIVLRV